MERKDFYLNIDLCSSTEVKILMRECNEINFMINYPDVACAT